MWQCGQGHQRLPQCSEPRSHFTTPRVCNATYVRMCTAYDKQPSQNICTLAAALSDFQPLLLQGHHRVMYAYTYMFICTLYDVRNCKRNHSCGGVRWTGLLRCSKTDSDDVNERHNQVHRTPPELWLRLRFLTSTYAHSNNSASLNMYIVCVNLNVCLDITIILYGCLVP